MSVLPSTRNAELGAALIFFVALSQLMVGCGTDKTSSDPAADRAHVRTYPVPGFRTEDHRLLLFTRPPQGQWMDLPQGHLPVVSASHDYDIAIRVDRPGSALVRGECGFDPTAGDQKTSTATFRIRLLLADGTELERLFEATLSSARTAFEKFEITVPAGREGPLYVGFDVRYQSPRSPRQRRAAIWVDPVIEELEPSRRPPRRDAPSLLLITADTTRQDVLGPYGGAAVTPSLDALAADGVVFDNGFSVAFGTAPSHASLLTSSYAAEHGLYDNQTILKPELVTLAETLHDAGYVTGGFVSAVPVARTLGFTQGFDLFDDLLGFDPRSGLGEFSQYERRADVTADRFLAWLEKHSDEPFFAWLHFYDPHQPYAPPGSELPRDAGGLYGYFETPEGAPKHLRLPAKLRSRPKRLGRVQGMAQQRYLAEVAHMDAQIGRVLERLREKGLYDDMIVAFVADHGENLSEREHPLVFEHQALFKDVTRLPFLLKLPGLQHAGSRREYLLGNLDIAPTLLEIAGLEAPAQWSGRSFRRLLSDPGGREFRPYLVLEGANREEISIRTRTLMYRTVLGDLRDQAEKLHFLGYAVDRPEEVYDLEIDPGETTALAPQGRGEVEALQALLRDFVAAGGAPAERLETPEHLEALKALGYIQ